jgi:hypothetical protein
MKKNLTQPRNIPQDFTTMLQEDSALVEIIIKQVASHLHKKKRHSESPRGPKLQSKEYFMSDELCSK